MAPSESRSSRSLHMTSSQCQRLAVSNNTPIHRGRCTPVEAAPTMEVCLGLMPSVQGIQRLSVAKATSGRHPLACRGQKNTLVFRCGSSTERQGRAIAACLVPKVASPTNFYKMCNQTLDTQAMHMGGGRADFLLSFENFLVSSF